MRDVKHPNLDATSDYISRYWVVTRAGSFTNPIYDFTGTMKKKIKGNNSSQIELNLSDLEKGIYFLEITTSTSTYKEKIVKE